MQPINHRIVLTLLLANVKAEAAPLSPEVTYSH